MATQGTILRRLRERRHLFQGQAADLAGLDRSFISRLESEQRRLMPDALDAIARGWQLTGQERDMLALAAGLAPTDPLALLAGEPELQALCRYLRDASVPAADRLRVRQIVGLLVEQAAGVRVTGREAA